MAFADTLALLPSHTTGANASGFLPPIFRTLGHLLFILSNVAEDEPDMTDDQLLAELAHAQEHWNARRETTALSAGTSETLGNFGTALGDAAREFTEWDRETRIRNLRDLTNRGASLSVILDRELLGLRGSDAGTSL